MAIREQPLGSMPNGSYRTGGGDGSIVGFIAKLLFVCFITPPLICELHPDITKLLLQFWAWFSHSIWAQLWYGVCWIIGYWVSATLVRNDKTQNTGKTSATWKELSLPEDRPDVYLNRFDHAKLAFFTTFYVAPIYSILIPACLAASIAVVGVLFLVIAIICYVIYSAANWTLGC